MSLDVDDARIREARGRLAAYARALVDRAGDEALAIHADVVGVEHVLLALMRDEDCAAHRVALHAFADPETIALEALAIAPGVLVVASESTRPFSTRAVEALVAARRSAAERGLAEVGVELVLESAVDVLPDAGRSALLEAGLEVPETAAAGAEDEHVSADGPLFRSFSTDAKRVLSAANRLAAAERVEPRAAISPGHLVLAALQTEESARRAGVSFQRARSLLAGHTLDRTPPPPRQLPPDGTLAEFLAGLPRGADSLDLLARVHVGETPELSELLARHKVTVALLERARGVFKDPTG